MGYTQDDLDNAYAEEERAQQRLEEAEAHRRACECSVLGNITR